MPLQVILILLALSLPSFAEGHSDPPPRAGGLGGVFWTANQGQWPGDFQFKCEIGNTTYYVTPKGMTVDFREVSEIVAPSLLGKNPQVPFDPSVVILNEVKDPSEKNAHLRGHVIQIHYAQTSRRQVSSPALPTECSDIPPRFSGGARGGEKLPHYSNYFLGSVSSNWRSRVPHYQTVIAEEVWPGINVEYRADTKGVETIYHVSPRADPTQIQMEYLGLDAPLRVDSQGNLALTTSLGEVKEQAPFAYQFEGRTQKCIESTYRIIDNNRVAFEFVGFDANKELVIDPLLYGTYFGGLEGVDAVNQFLYLPSGEVLICGYSASSDFPTTLGVYQEQLRGRYNAYIAKLVNEGRDIGFCTFLGDSGYVHGTDIDEMPNGDLVLSGFAERGSRVPLTANALDTISEDYEGFVALFNSNCTQLLYSSYLGGSNEEILENAVVNSQGTVMLTGRTNSPDFPLTPDALETERVGWSNAFVTVMDLNTPSIVFSTLYGHTGCQAYDLALKNDSTVWIVGEVTDTGLTVTDDAYQSQYGGEVDAFIAQIQTRPPELLYSTYFGQARYDRVYSFEPIEAGRLALYGATRSDSWPTTSGAYDTILTFNNQSDGFITIFAAPDTIVFSTLFGSDFNDIVTAGARSPSGSYVIAGETKDQNLPVTPDAVDPTFGPNQEGETTDLFVLQLSQDLSILEYCSYFGGNNHERIDKLCVPNDQTIWTAGFTSSHDFPLTPDALDPVIGGFDTDGFVSCIGVMTNAREPNPATFPSNFGLTAYPNPFNPTTTLSFSLPRATITELSIHNILGQEIEHIVFGTLEVGEHQHSVGNSSWTTGLYFATIKTPSFTKTAKLLLLR